MRLGASDKSRASGFTLAELVVSTAVMSVVMVGIGSAILIASHALPGEGDPTRQLLQTDDVLNQIVGELQEACHIAERTANAVTFTVADRDGDGSPERIRYAWENGDGQPGTGGDPLTRQYNDGPGIVVLEDVRQFSLAYELKSVTEQYPGPPVEGAEVLLSSYTHADDLKDYKVDKDHWIGQYFKPADAIFPADAVNWRVTRVRFPAKEEGYGDEDTFVQLRLPDAENKPTDTVLEQQTMHEWDLRGWYVWQDFSFAAAPALMPGEGLCLVLQHQGSGGGSARIRYEDDNDYGATGRLKTSDRGGSWEYRTDKSMQYEIYGRVATPGPDQTATRHYVTSIRIALQAGDQADLVFDTAVSTLNTPELVSAIWETDFDTDPTVLDMNADGDGDWVVRGGGSFDPGSLSGGIWYADTTLDTYPENEFTGLITAEVRFRNTSIGGNGAVFWINADWSASKFAPIFAYLQLQEEGTQNLTVYHKVSSSQELPVATVRGLSGGFVTLRLLIDPALDTVNVKVNGEERGTYFYNTLVPTNNDRFATVLPWGSDAEFDYVSVRVGVTN